MTLVILFLHNSASSSSSSAESSAASLFVANKIFISDHTCRESALTLWQRHIAVGWGKSLFASPTASLSLLAWLIPFGTVAQSLYQSYDLKDGNTSLTDSKDWGGVYFLFCEIIFWGIWPWCHPDSRKLLSWEKDKEYPARSVNNLASVKLQDYPGHCVYPSHLPFLTLSEARCKYVLYFEM